MKPRELDLRLRSLGEIRDILSAMKNMARMEVHRLERFLATQRRVVTAIESAARDLRAFHPELFAGEQDERCREVYVVLGSERGFCGNFNESLLRVLAARAQPGPGAAIVAVGGNLRNKIGDDTFLPVFLPGAGVVEEVEDTMVRLMDALSGEGIAKPHRSSALRVTVIHHTPAGGEIGLSLLSPSFGGGDKPPQYAYEPMLNLDPVSFAAGLLEQYLFARLHELVYGSLMAENEARVAHMQAAVERLDRKLPDLRRRRNVLRQEEITEEIEVIMLSADLLEPGTGYADAGTYNEVAP
ncbi:MAG: FoF1 ATP synthase subunit gamma [Bryobacteraceae bacterium]